MVVGVSKLEVASSGVHGGAKLLHGFIETDEDGAGNDRVSDVQLLDFRDRGHGADVSNRKSVTRVDEEPECGSALCGGFESAHGIGLARRVSVASRVQLDRDRAKIARLLYRADIRIDEQARSNAGAVHARNAVGQTAAISRHVQAAFGGDLLSTFRYERDLVRTK